MDKEKCFIIMPVTTPADLIERYSGDKNHFKHVLEHLFIPAIEKVGFEPVAPIVKGSEVIHAEIIKNIEQSKYVLCDMSILNPNVFFELGIRTAINKSIALVRDDITNNIPFDTNIVNNHTYSHKLEPWTIETQIAKLSTHLENCFKKGKETNSLWDYFSLSVRPDPLKDTSDQNDQIKFLTMQIEALRKDISHGQSKIQHSVGSFDVQGLLEDFKKIDLEIDNAKWKGSKMTVTLFNEPNSNLILVMNSLATQRGISLEILFPKKDKDSK